MIDRLDSNMQSLGALALATNASAHNVANMATSGYDPLRTVFTSGPDFVSAVVERSYAFGQAQPQPGFEIAQDQRSQERAWQHPYLGGHVDIGREMVNLIQYERAFQANAKAVRTVEQTTGSILSLFA